MKTVSFDSDCNDVTCMKEYDALENPCDACGNRKCDERVMHLDFPYKIELHDTDNARYMLENRCKFCEGVCSDSKRDRCDKVMKEIEYFYNLEVN